MKKNKNIFMASVLLLSLGLASCTDSFLDVTSKTESSTGTFYKTEKDAYRALIGCYDGWRQTSSAMMVGFYMASEVMSAECFGATGNADGRGYQAIDRFDISQSPADLNLYEGDWKNYYAGVYRCNELIAHVQNVQRRGEVYELIRLSEDLILIRSPLGLHNTIHDNETKKKRINCPFKGDAARGNNDLPSF